MTTSTTQPVTVDVGGSGTAGLADVFEYVAGVDSGSGAAGRSSAALIDSSLGTSWFGDVGGVLDVALWGAVCVLIVLAVRLASRRLGHRYLWRAFGVPLFVVALFFFYENLGRVLPASV